MFLNRFHGVSVRRMERKGASPVPVETSQTLVAASLQDLLSKPYAINVHESQANIQNYIACGDIGGALMTGSAMAQGGVLAIGLKDSFRLFGQPPQSFTWWDYRMNAFRRKMGLRIDHILLSRRLADACRACSIDLEPRRNERPSDHAPVTADFATA